MRTTHQLSVKERKEFLLKPIYDYHDVMKITGYRKSKAIEIMNECKKKYNGSVLFNSHAITRNSLLEYMGTSIEQERYVLHQLEETET